MTRQKSPARPPAAPPDVAGRPDGSAQGSNSVLSATVPLRIRSESNLREHWRVKSARTKRERDAAKIVVRAALWSWRLLERLEQPYLVRLVRIIGPRGRALDGHDNLRAACKHAVDGVADALGVDDGDLSAVTWDYGAQERGEDWGLRIEISERPTEAAASGSALATTNAAPNHVTMDSDGGNE
jgi:hypothetical protein